MKPFIVILCVLLLTGPLHAWQQQAVPAVCHATAAALQELHQDGFEPQLVTKFTVNPPEKLVVVWVNASRHVVVTVTEDLENVSVTCIVAIGNTDTVILPEREKQDL